MQETNKIQLKVKSEYFYEMMQRIKQRPGMYLGKSSITNLRSFLDGYMGARRDLGLPETDEETEFYKFHDWIQKRFDIKSYYGWNDIILLNSIDERDALNKFFVLFEQFKNGESASR
ncbi:hypothetical protein NIES267_08160 [Calothrix parasitica NIES-267]|uniref:Uncharacterized protein n=1 Tax=Calothrix parasitica NIES-267 TaxID=1973488 RepID=A0A1Z4LJC0_9CYAN|nr:hypothetical protein NIES267_08160 [Calothrix parasitica NIES-267]